MVKIVPLTVLFLTVAWAWCVPPEDATRQRLVDLALSLQGTPYRYAAESPRGFDCSGFIHYVYSNAAFVDVPRTSRSQSAQGLEIDLANAQPGDVLLYGSSKSGVSHVALYLGNGALVHAASRGPQRGIVVANLTDHYFESHFLGVRSFFPLPDPGRLPAPTVGGETVNWKLAVSATPTTVTEAMPVFLGSTVGETVVNDTGADATFTVTIDQDGADSWLDQTTLAVGGRWDLDAFVPPAPGRYRLTVAGTHGEALLTQEWRVVQRWGS